MPSFSQVHFRLWKWSQNIFRQIYNSVMTQRLTDTDLAYAYSFNGCESRHHDLAKFSLYMVVIVSHYLLSLFQPVRCSFRHRVRAEKSSCIQWLLLNIEYFAPNKFLADANWEEIHECCQFGSMILRTNYSLLLVHKKFSLLNFGNYSAL